MNSDTSISTFVSREELLQFLEGNIDAERSAAIRQMADEDPLLADAIEGLQLLEAPAQSFQKLDRKAHFSSLHWITYGTLVLVALGVAVWLWSGTRPAHQGQQLSSFSPLSEVENRFPTALSFTETQSDPQPSDDRNYIMAYHTTDSSVNVARSLPASRTNVEPSQYLHVKTIDDIEAALASFDEPVDEPRVKRSHEDVYHIEDYKVVDYRGKRTEQFRQWEVDPGGVSARFENSDQQSNDRKIPRIVQVPYTEFLNDAIVEYARGHFKEAAHRFQLILKTYPKDANAQFYLGMTLFQQGSYALSSAALAAAGENEISTFHEDARFYRAKALLNQGARQEAIYLWEEIADQGGFYAAQSRDLLAKHR